MTVFATLYNWQKIAPEDSSALLDGFVAHPEFLSYPHTPEEARVIGANMLVDPTNLIWATYSDDTLTGVIILTRIVPRVDALLHFLFLDKDLSSKRKLLKKFLGTCFNDLGFHRLSMEVPEGVRLERFARKALGFRLEGEIRDHNPELPKSLSDTWVARQGSRREQAYFNGSAWSDIVLLRLLSGEWVGEQEGECRSELPHQSLPPSPGPPQEVSSEGVGPRTPSPSSPRTSSPSDSRTSGSSSTC